MVFVGHEQSPLHPKQLRSCGLQAGRDGGGGPINNGTFKVLS